MSIDIKKLYSSGYPEIGSRLIFRDKSAVVVLGVTCSTSRVMGQYRPKVRVRCFNNRGVESGVQEYDLDEFTQWSRDTTIEPGPIKVVSPRVT